MENPLKITETLVSDTIIWPGGYPAAGLTSVIKWQQYCRDFRNITDRMLRDDVYRRSSEFKNL